jgi:hypothetical protein
MTDEEIRSAYLEAIQIAAEHGDMVRVYVYARMLIKAFHRYCF